MFLCRHWVLVIPHMKQDVHLDSLSAWCEAHLDSGIDTLLFETGFSGRVLGVRLRDSREVVLKLRPHTPRIRGAAVVQQFLWKTGFPCPQLLVSPRPYASTWISAEVLVHGGQVLTDDPDAPEL